MLDYVRRMGSLSVGQLCGINGRWDRSAVATPAPRCGSRVQLIRVDPLQLIVAIVCSQMVGSFHLQKKKENNKIR